MSDPSAAAPPPAEPQRSSGFFANLIDLYFAPAEAFANMLRKPNFVVPTILYMVLSVAFFGIWLQKVDMAAFFAARMQESGRTPRPMPAEVMQEVETWTRNSYMLAAVLLPPVFVAGLAGFFLFIYRFFYAGELRFVESLAIVASSFAAYSLVTIPLMLGVLALKDDWTIIPQEALLANLSLFLEKQTTAKWLWALGSSMDLFAFWLMFLLATGFGTAAKRNWTWALPGIVVPWALVFVLGRMALVSLLS